MNVHELADLGDKAKLQEWFDSYNEGASPDLNAGDKENGFSALHFAAAKGHFECLQLLLSKGANVNNNQNTYNTTPLHEGARGGNTECVKLLIESGANVNAQDHKGWSVLHYAVINENEETVEAILQTLIDKGAMVGVSTLSGETALHVAADRGNSKALSLLIRHGASLAQRNSSEQTPFALLQVSALDSLAAPIGDLQQEVAQDLKDWVAVERFADVTLKAKADEKLFAHKIILSARSSHFRQLLEADPSPAEIDLSDITKENLKVMLDFLYTGTSAHLESPPNSSFLFDLWESGKRFNLNNLQDSITSAIASHSSVIEKDTESLRRCVSIVKGGEAGPMGNFCRALLLRAFPTLVEAKLDAELSSDEWASLVSQVAIDDSGTLTPDTPAPKVPEKSDSRPLVGKNLRMAKGIMRNIMKEPYYEWFAAPVDPIAMKIPDYHHFIKNPMDLGTIRSKLDKNAYNTIGEWQADIALTFSNCRAYNTPSSQIAGWGDAIERTLEQKIAATAWDDTGVKSPKMKASTSSGSNINLEGKKRKADTLSIVKNDIPAKKSKEAPMTFEEKKNLGQAMNLLDSNQLIEAIEILKECPKIREKQSTDEESDTIDIDMNEVDDPTLRKLERFIEQCGVLKREN